MSVRCPRCGVKVDVPAGHHTVTEIQERGGKTIGIAVDGTATHRCVTESSPVRS